MKPEEVTRVLRSMDMDQVTKWFNHWNDHYGTDYRCMIVKKSDTASFDRMMKCVYAFDKDTSKMYVYYDYDSNRVMSFDTVEEVLDYFDIDVYCIRFEDCSWAEVFGWMKDMPEKTVHLFKVPFRVKVDVNGVYKYINVEVKVPAPDESTAGEIVQMFATAEFAGLSGIPTRVK